MTANSDTRAPRFERRMLGGLLLGFATLLFLTVCLASVAMAQGPYEPNDSFETAYGPLAADTTYSSILETDDDIDYFYFYVTSHDAADAQITITDLMADRDGGIYAELDDADGNMVDSSDIDSGDSDTLDESLDPGKYFLSVEQGFVDQSGEAYEIQTSGTEGAFGSQAQVNSRCKAAETDVAAAKAALAKAEKQLRKARTRSRKTKARHAIKVAKANLKNAQAEATSWC